MLGPRRWKALFGLLSVVAVVGPAAGLAVLGIQQTRAERVRARQVFDEANRKEAHFVATTLDNDARQTLDAVAQLFAGSGLPGRTEVARVLDTYELAENVFYVDASGRVAWPPSRPSLASDFSPERRARVLLSGPAQNFEAYVKRLRQERRMRQILAQARAAESGPQSRVEARRGYEAVARRSDPLGAEALLGLARLELGAGRSEEARARFDELNRRFGGLEDREGVPYALLADLGAAQALGDARSLVDVYGGLVDGRYEMAGPGAPGPGRRSPRAPGEPRAAPRAARRHRRAGHPPRGDAHRGPLRRLPPG